MATAAKLVEDDVILDLDAGSKRGLLEFLAARAAQRTGLPTEEVLEALNAREKMGSTALGKGVALPHAELREDITPLLLFAHLRRPIDFDAQDDEPVDLVILALWPATAGKEMLPTISGICRILREPLALRELRLAQTADRVVQVLQALEGPDPGQAAARPLN